MTRPVLWTLLLACAGLCGPASVQAGQTGQDERVFLEEAKRDLLEKLDQCVLDRDWRRLFEHYTQALQRYGNSVVPLGVPAENRWTSVREHLVDRFSKLPKEAFEAYRFDKDGPARAAFEKAREAGSRLLLERAAEEYFFSSTADEVIDALAREAFDEGRAAEAALHWNRLLRFHPDTDFPKAATAARLAVALRAAGSDSGLADLKAWVLEKGLRGRIVQGGREIELSALLEEPPGPAAAAAGTPVAPQLPETPGPEDQGKLRPRGAWNDIRRWSYDPAFETSKGTASSNPQPGTDLPSPQGIGDYPLLPAFARFQGKEYVVVSDGSRVLAFDPLRVKGASGVAGMYWKYPPDRAVSRALPVVQNQNQGTMPRVAVGAAIFGDQVIVPMFSKLEVRPRDGTPPQDTFEGSTSIKCLHLPTGRLIWDTDLKPLIEELRSVGRKFFERNFAFCGTPLVSGDRIFVPVCTSPAGDLESHVICLDRRSGRPLWTTFLASVVGMQGMMGQGLIRPVYQTTLAEAEGLLFAQTNLGVTAALHPTTGTLQWLARYRRVGRKQSNMGLEPAFHRGPGPPLVWNGKLYVLAQDQSDLLSFEASTGRALKVPPVLTTAGEFDWRTANYLLGPSEDSLVLAGSPTSYVLRLRTFNAYRLSLSNTRGMGRGVLQNGLLYLPVSGAERGPTGALARFDMRTWKLATDAPWRETGDGGNLLIAGDSLVAAGRRLSVYHSLAKVREHYRRNLEQSPPQGLVLLEYGDLMLENGRLEEAAEAYEKFVHAAAGNPDLDARVRQVKSDLYGIFLRRGREALGRNDPARAVEAFAYARSFAWNGPGELEAIVGRVKALEGLGRWDEAVAAHQEILEHSSALFFRDADRLSRSPEASLRRILEIKAAHPDSYVGLERRAREELVRADSEDALVSVMDRFPHSPAARDAFQRLRLLKKDPEALALLLSEFSGRFGEEPDRALLLEWADAADRAGLRRPFERSLTDLERRFGTEKTGPEGQEETVADLVRRRRLERVWPAPEISRAGGRLRKASSLVTGTEVPLIPLRPEGPLPVSFKGTWELFSAGSSVELWDVEGPRRRNTWSKPKQGGPEEPQGEAPIDAAYTGAGGLAVAWKDSVSLIDFPSSRVRWTFRPGRARFVITGMKAVGELLYVHEAPLPELLLRESWTPEEAHRRLYCLSAASGALLWGRAIDFDPQQPSLEVSLTFVGRSSGDAGLLLYRHHRPGGALAVFELWTVLDSGAINRRPLSGTVLSYAWEPVRGIFYYVGDQAIEQRERHLYGLALAGGKDVVKPLHADRLMPRQYTVASLVVTPDWVGLALHPPSAGGEARLLAWTLPDFEERILSLPEGRTMYGPGGVAAGSGGEWLVYNQRREPRSQGGTASFLSAYRPKGPPGGALLWDAPAPSLIGAWLTASFKLEDSGMGHVVLTTLSGSIPGLGDGAGVAVYDLPAEGLVRFRSLGPAPASGSALRPAAPVRGRLYVRTSAGLDVYVRE